MRILAAIALLTTMTACSGLNQMLYQGKCTSGDWSSVGYSDGQSGLSNNVGSWTNRCAEFKTKPDTVAYAEGHKRGKVDFCRRQGETLGAKGETQTPRQCTTGAEVAAFRSSLGDGKASYCRTQGNTAGQAGGRAKPPTQCLDRQSKDEYMNAYVNAIKTTCTKERGAQRARSRKAYQKHCPKDTPYFSGYHAELRTYCNPKNAQAMGKKATVRFNHRICPRRSQKKLRSIYLNAAKIGKYEKAIVSLEKEITDLETKLFSNKTPADAKVHYKEILADKRAKLRSTERALYKAERL